MNIHLREEIENWIIGQDYYWQKLLGLHLLQSNDSTDVVEDCLIYFEKELINNPKEKIKNEIEIKNIEKKAVLNKPLKLYKIQDIKNVNALISNQSIELNDSLTVIYGSNGSGKSSYSRLLNNAFYSRGDKSILPNIFVEKKTEIPTCSFIFSTPETEIPLTFPNDKDRPEFTQFSVFDSKSSKIHLDNENNLLFTPSGFDFFDSQIKVFNILKTKIEDKIKQLKKPNPFSQYFTHDNIICEEIINLGLKSNLLKIKALADFSEADDAKIQFLNVKKAELNQEAIVKKIEHLNQVKKSLTLLKGYFEKANMLFSEEELSKIFTTFKNYISYTNLVKIEGIESLKEYDIQGLDSDEWKAFILTAKNYIDHINNEHNTNKKCPFCLQNLSITENELITKYWILLKSHASEELKKSRDSLNEYYNKLKSFDNVLFDSTNLVFQFLNGELLEYVPIIEKEIEKTLVIKDSMLAFLVEKNETFFPKAFSTDLIGVIELEKLLSTKINELVTLKIDEKLKEVNQELDQILDKKLLSTFYDKIVEYIDTINWIERAEASLAKLNPRSITIKQNELYTKYITNKYDTLFHNECRQLNAPKFVEVTQKPSKGKTFKSLKIKNYDPSQILSEGEQRVIALADFLTEIQLDDNNRGIIFDDPVTSLDDNWKSVIAQRLVNESSERQVIIFTHDLVFLEMLKSRANEKKISLSSHWIEKTEESVGIIWNNNSPSLEKDYKTSGKAKNYYENARKQAPELREATIKNGFAALRTSYEAIVVFDLFEGVVQRFMDRVSIDSLSKVYIENNIKKELIDSFHLCCRYMEGHLHSNKYSYIKPQLENLNEEIDRFENIKKKIKDFKNSQNVK